MKKIIVSTILATAFLSAANQNGQELFKAKCSVCHKLGAPKHDENAVAPMLVGLVTHLKESFKKEDDLKNHIKEFVVNPTKEKAICPSIKRFGLMPSQKGAVTKEELEKIAEFMVKQKGMNGKEHDQMQGNKHKGGKMSFESIDTNNDGVVSKEEFIQAKKKRMKMHKKHGEGKGCSK